jgi:hypothetical protein
LRTAVSRDTPYFKSYLLTALEQKADS